MAASARNNSTVVSSPVLTLSERVEAVLRPLPAPSVWDAAAEDAVLPALHEPEALPATPALPAIPALPEEDMVPALLENVDPPEPILDPMLMEFVLLPVLFPLWDVLDEISPSEVPE